MTHLTLRRRIGRQRIVMLISPTEPPEIKQLGEVSPFPERRGCDVLITVPENRTIIGVQRKRFPDDLLASLADGRLYSQLTAMREGLDHRVLIVEGHGRWTTDGQLYDMSRFTMGQLFGLLWSVGWEFGVQVRWVRNIGETKIALESLERWARKERHDSLRRRPGPKRSKWGTRSSEDWLIHLMQSFPGMGPELAVRFVGEFGGVPLRWDVEGPEVFERVPGIGSGKARKLWEALQ